MSEPICPLMREPCITHRCMLYISILGEDPQTKEVLNKFVCSIAILPKLIIENTKAVRETDDEISKFRSDTHKTQQHFARSMLGAVAEMPLLQREADK